MYASTGEFVAALDRAGELRRVGEAVSPVLEIAAWADRASKSPAPRAGSASSRSNDPRLAHLGGPALLFENVVSPDGSRSDIPVLINAWGSYRRMEMALGCHDEGHTPGGFDALGAKIGALVKPEPPRGLAELIAKARQFLPLLRIPPKRRKGLGACQQVVQTGAEVDLTQLPLIRCWPHDGDFAALGYPAGVNDHIPGLGRGDDWERSFRGRYITLAGIHTIHADDLGNPRPPSHNIGMYRVQLLGRRTLAMHWHMHHDGAAHWRSWKRKGEKMPVAIVLGGESVLPYAATAPLPPGISELLLAGFLNRGGIPMVMGRTVPIWVPASAEIVIEGYVSHRAGFIGWDPRRSGAAEGGASGVSGVPGGDRFGIGEGAVFEGPFGDHTGFYSLPDRYPILEVTAVTRRRDAIYPTTVVGLPPQEDYFLGKATERLFRPLLKTLIHDIEDYDLPLFGAFHNCAFVKIRKAYPLQARRVMHAIWGAGQMAWTKTIFVVDDDVDCHDLRAVMAAAAAHCDPARDIETVNGPLDILDHAAPRLAAGMKVGFDCTRKVAGEEVNGVPVAQGAPGGGAPADAAALLERVRGIPGVVAAATPAIAPGWLMVSVRKTAPGQGAAVLEQAARLAGELGGARFIAVLGEGVRVDDADEALFHWVANSDASRDALLIRPEGRPGVMGFDATPKLPGDERHGQPVRDFPPVLSMPPEVAARAGAR
ncbi:MAG: UbiD family decarboxylase [Phycisphaerales bacterium]|nr:UbiD family decarboxylase [Phycisphaerales bacterium]